MKKCILFIAITMCCLVYSYAQEQLPINTNTSKLKWSCDYSFYFGGHFGFVQFQEGYFIKTKGKIMGGTFVINLNSISNTDVESVEANAGIVEHLKNEDFFDVKNHPTAKLVITSTSYHDDTHLKVMANLTIKDITLAVNFEAEVDFLKKQLITKFKIDRTLWGIDYKSKSVMDKLQSGAISDAIGFEVVLML